MTRLRVSLVGVPSEVRCAKPGCTVASHNRLQRHHKAHQKMWFGVWGKRRRGEEKWRLFIERYYKFLPIDIVLLCDRHHAEIHSIYDKIIANDRAAQTGLPLHKYSWTQAERLMGKLIKACDDWLKKETPGIDSATFGETRRVYQSMLNREARKRQKRPRSA